MKPNTENLRLGSKKKAEILWMKKDLSWFTKKIVDSYQLDSKIAKRINHKIMMTLFGKDSDSDDWQENDTDKKREREKMK